MMHNNWEEPSGVIDHINGNSLDNRILPILKICVIEAMLVNMVLKHGTGFKVEFTFKGVYQFYPFSSIEDAIEFRNKVALDIANDMYELKRPINSMLPEGVFKKKSKTHS